MSIEEEYYEIEEFWTNETLSPIDFERIESIVKLIPSDIKNVLDVGCGNGVFLNYLQQNSTIEELHGVDRSKTALKYVKTQKTRANINSLPFIKNRFNLVTSLEVIEHLPESCYYSALREIARVAQKYVIISVPNNQKLEDSLIPCPECKTMFNPDYHMHSFDDKKMKNLFSGFDLNCISIHYIGPYYESIRLNPFSCHFGKNKNPFLNDIPCPVCGFQIRGKNRILHNQKNFSNESSIKKKISQILPKKINYRWIAGLYKK